MITENDVPRVQTETDEKSAERTHRNLDHTSAILDLTQELYPSESIGLLTEQNRTFTPVAEVNLQSIHGSYLRAVVIKEETTPSGEAVKTTRYILGGFDPREQLPVLNGGWKLLGEGVTSLGRNPGSVDVWGNSALADVSLSRSHTTLKIENDRLTVTDESQFGSTGVEGFVVEEETDDSQIPEVVKNISERGFAELAPVFSEQLKDAETGARAKNLIRHNFTDPNGNTSTVSSEESEELMKLARELSNARSKLLLDSARSGNPETEELLRLTDSFEDLTFIGKQELDEAVKGLADYWTSYLQANPNATIQVLAAKREDMGGSFGYMYSRVLDAIKSSEQGRGSGETTPQTTNVSHRIRYGSQVDKALLADPTSKLVFLDDWAISERSLKNHALSVFDQIPESDRLGYLEKTEVNLVFGFPEQVSYGIELADGHNAPVKAYFQGRKKFSYTEANVTGAHASVDYGFEEPLRRIVQATSPGSVVEILTPNGARKPSSWWQTNWGNNKDTKTLFLFDLQRNYRSHRNH